MNIQDNMINVKIDEVIAIGDQESDLELLKKVGKGYSMPHSPDYIKKKAIAKFTRLGKGEVLAISSRQIYNVVKKNIKINYWFLTKKGIKKIK